MTERQPLRILLTGGFPPPYGGVTVYIKRLFDYLNMQGHDCHVYDQVFAHLRDSEITVPDGVEFIRSKWNLLWRILADKSYDIIHINEFSWKHRCALVLLARLKNARSLITLHSLRDDFQAMSLTNRLAVNLTLKFVDYIISSGKNEVERLQRLYPLQKVRVLTPYMPPRDTGYEEELPEKIEEFCEGHTYVACANGSNLFIYSEEDAYGLDMLVDGCYMLRKNWDLGIIYCLSGIENEENIKYLESYRARIQELGLNDHILIYMDTIEFWKVIRRCDIFVRPSRTDSFGISVAESIYLKKPAIASDVCWRPAGTTVFASGNTNAMVEAIAGALYAMGSDTWEFNPEPPEDGSVLLESLYYELVEGAVVNELGVQKGEPS